MSRYSGCWIGFKCVGDTVESSASVAIDPDRIDIKTPEDFEMPDGGLNIRYPDDWMEQERRLLNYKLPAAQAFVRANGLDRLIADAPNARLGIITTGKAYLDVRQALEELGIDEAAANALGIRLYKVAMTWPLEPRGAAAFARGLEEILVVEEKRPLIEDQLATLLYHVAHAPRRIVGKKDELGAPLLPIEGELTPGMVAKAIAGRLRRFADRPEFEQRLARLEQIEIATFGAPPSLQRSPYFCSGCPHNSSTRVPDGSRAMAGIGCHGMTLWMPERRTQTITHMGGEGVNWLGQAPFTSTGHVFQNLGDGTYHHSGLMAIRAAVSGGANITYKILYNDAVAMTGGQPLGAAMTPAEITQQVHHEGVKKVLVVTDEPEKYPIGTNWAPGVAVYHRDELDAVQRQLREIKGVTVLLYDQTCAAEKRRRRKRGEFPDPPKRAFINDLVCEGCGDCSVKSNCVSVEPLDTEWGRKRRINQSACNKDFSCVNGFCPSFVTVHGGEIRRADREASGFEALLAADLPTPRIPPSSEPYGILITGIGGTGVVTIGALLGMAAHLEGKGISGLDQAGLAQKNGAVTSHVRIADNPDDLHAVRIGTGGARLLLGCDIVVAASAPALATLNEGVSHAVINTHVVPTAGFLADQTLDFSARAMIDKLERAGDPARCHFVDATELATALLGDAIATNLFMVGFAYQKGLLPLSAEAIVQAIDLNAVAVESNKRAFTLGRLAAHDPAAVAAAARPLVRIDAAEADDRSLAAVVARRVDYLSDYQDAAYAARYQVLVDAATAAETERAKGRTGLAEAVARNFFKLLAYKDEYEVARLYTNGAFQEKLRQQFDGDVKLTFHLAPPLASARDPLTGEAQKREYGPWVFTLFKLLARLRRLRGGPFDIFGRTAERRMERQLITGYEATMKALFGALSQENHDYAVRIAELPDEMRGFGHVKQRNVEQAKALEADLLAAFRDPAPRASAAE